MSRITVIGGTGFAGHAIAQEAVKRGHDVTILSRSAPQNPLADAQYMQSSISDEAIHQQLLNDSDVIVATAAPRGDMEGKLKPAYLALARNAASSRTRLVYIGGFSSLRPAPGQLRFFESGDIPAEYKAEAIELATTFDELQNTAFEADWLFISPAATFGTWANIPDTGAYRVSNDVALFDQNNESKISANDFAIAVLDEIEQPRHSRQNISFTQ